jgi:hypothetical protein
MKILSAVAAIIFFAVGATAQTTNGLSDAEIQGRNLAQQLLEQSPATNLTQTGVLNIRDGKGTINASFNFAVRITDTNWQALYSGYLINSNSMVRHEQVIRIVHAGGQQNHYEMSEVFYRQKNETNVNVDLIDHRTSRAIYDANGMMVSFFGSDFWLADLGLEFFHWPEQKILKKENRRSRACNVLESTNPNPSTNGYSRVDSWIDEESGGIVHADAYDFKNKLLKEFDPKSFKKVNGQWELQEMEIRNVQTKSRSRIEFDLKK